LAIVGNKVDLKKDRVVSLEEATEFAQSVGAVHYETSAKENFGVKEMFGDLVRSM
jgi:Ras-related protein Rab-21